TRSKRDLEFRRVLFRSRRIHHKSNQGATLLGWSKNARPWQFGQAIACMARQLQVMLENCCAPDSIKIINRRSETDSPRDIWRAKIGRASCRKECGWRGS